MAEGDLVIITGLWDTYKSTTALELGYALATGKPWLRAFHVHKKGVVGVLQAEINPGFYDDRLLAYPPADNLLICSDLSFDFDHLDDLREAIEVFNMDVLILDPLGQMYPDKASNGEPFKENEKAHVARLMKRLKLLPATVILVHHDPKASASGLANWGSGSSSFMNDPDVRIHLERDYDKGTVQMQVRNRNQTPAHTFSANYVDRRLIARVS